MTKRSEQTTDDPAEEDRPWPRTAEERGGRQPRAVAKKSGRRAPWQARAQDYKDMDNIASSPEGESPKDNDGGGSSEQGGCSSSTGSSSKRAAVGEEAASDSSSDSHQKRARGSSPSAIAEPAPNEQGLPGGAGPDSVGTGDQLAASEPEVFLYEGGKVAEARRSKVTHVRIGAQVTEIPNSAFFGCQKLVEVHI